MKVQQKKHSGFTALRQYARDEYVANIAEGRRLNRPQTIGNKRKAANKSACRGPVGGY